MNPDDGHAGIRGSRILRMKWLLGLMLVGYLPTMGLLALLAEGDYRVTVVFGVLGPLWVLAMPALAVAMAFVKCPACGRPFSRRGCWAHPFSRSCVHCGQRV